MSYCLDQASAFFKEGYNVVLYDYRGFGESSDFVIDKNMMYYDEYSEDLSSVVYFVKKQYKTKSIFLYGISMGCIVSNTVLNKDNSIKGAIYDSFPIDPSLVTKRILEAKNKTITLPSGAEKYIANNKRKLTIPVLIFSGLRDTFTKTEDYNNFMLLNRDSRLVTWDCNHIQAFYTMTKINPSDLYLIEINNYITAAKLL